MKNLQHLRKPAGRLCKAVPALLAFLLLAGSGAACSALLLTPSPALAANSGGTAKSINGNSFYIGTDNYINSGNTEAKGANVQIDSTGFTGNVEGGWVNAPATGKATNNHVTVTGGTVSGSVEGGAGWSGATGNSVTLTNGKARGVVGGRTVIGDATGNSVSISGTSTVVDAVIGGNSASDSATGNTVTIQGGTFGDGTDYSGHIYGGTTETGSATHNTVNIEGGTIGTTAAYSGIVMGGYSWANLGDLFTGNTLNMRAQPTSVNEVRNFEFINFSYAGDARIKVIFADTGQDVNINTAAHAVNIDGKLSGAGGFTKVGTGTLTLTGANTYSGMTTVQAGTLKLDTGGSLASKDLTLYGGATFENSGALTRSLNRGSLAHSLDGGSLIVNAANGQSATYKGDLTATNAALHFISSATPTKPLLVVTGNADISGSQYNVGLSGGTQLAAGSQLTLLKVDAGKTLKADNLTKGSGIIQIGSTVAHDVTTNVKLDPATGQMNAVIPGVKPDPEPGVKPDPNPGPGDDVTAEIHPGRATEQAKALSEGFLGGVSLAVQGADLAAGQGTMAAVNAARNAGNAPWGFAGFGALSGASTRTTTGSYIDVQSLSLLTGLAKGADTAAGRVTVGVFFEYGNAAYDTHNAFSHSASVDGDGNGHYLGGGVLARMDFMETGPGHLYAEASGRAGMLHNEYDNKDMRDALGRSAEYESDTPYYGLHLGAGYVWNFSEKASLDLYGKYFWTRVQGDSFNLSTGERLKFENVDSNRLRFGGRLAYTVNDYMAPYIGAAWEHEFGGRARGTTNGYDIDAPSLKGSTGIAEVGLTWRPAPQSPLAVDLGVQGFVGRREGVSGNVQLRFEF